MRPTLCTPELTHRICIHLEAGVPIKWACKAEGVSESIYHHWIAQAREIIATHDKDTADDLPQSPYLEFMESTMRARAKGVTSRVAVIQRHGVGVPIYQEDKQGNKVLDEQGKPIIKDWLLKPEWRAAAWYLERVFPEDFKQKLDVSNEDRTLAPAVGLGGLGLDKKERDTLRQLIKNRQDSAQEATA